MIFLQRRNHRDRKQISGYQGEGLGSGVDYRGVWGNSGKGGALVYLNYGGSCTNLCVYQHSLNYTHRVNFTICKLYLNFKNVKPELESVFQKAV